MKGEKKGGDMQPSPHPDSNRCGQMWPCELVQFTCDDKDFKGLEMFGPGTLKSA